MNVWRYAVLGLPLDAFVEGSRLSRPDIGGLEDVLQLMSESTIRDHSDWPVVEMRTAYISGI